MADLSIRCILDDIRLWVLVYVVYVMICDSGLRIRCILGDIRLWVLVYVVYLVIYDSGWVAPRHLLVLCDPINPESITNLKIPWREAGPPNHLSDDVDLDQPVVHEELSL